MNFGTTPLTNVFGISRDVPKYTYVDRQMLDRKFEHYFKSQKHIVVHGASKQGKSCLRRKNIDEKNCVLVQCLPSMIDAEKIWKSALEQMSKNTVVTLSKTDAANTHAGTEAQATAGIPLIGKVEGKIDLGVGTDTSTTQESTPIRGDSYLPLLAKHLRERGVHLILEDFHYLPEEARLGAAFGLKSLYEDGVYVIVVGIWSEQNLITYYNGDLTGRIEEINLTWTDEELNQVLLKGEGALNIEFATGLRSQLIESAFSNVGLLQRLAEKVCMGSGVYASQAEKQILADISLLGNARASIIGDIRQRYTRIAGVFKEGMRTDAELHLYGRIYNELIDASDTELMEGISFSDLLERIQAKSKKTIRQSDLTQALDRIEKLQASREITPLLTSYSKSVRKLFLNDREFLFYRKFSGDNTNDLKINLETV